MQVLPGGLSPQIPLAERRPNMPQLRKRVLNMLRAKLNTWDGLTIG